MKKNKVPPWIRTLSFAVPITFLLYIVNRIFNINVDNAPLFYIILFVLFNIATILWISASKNL